MSKTHAKQRVVILVALVSVICCVGIPLYERIQEHRRLEQVNENLRKIGLAIHAYSQAQRVFPPSSSRHRPGQVALRRIFWLLRLQQV